MDFVCTREARYRGGGVCRVTGEVDISNANELSAHAAEALNFSVTLVIAYIVCVVLIFVLIGLVLLPIVWIGSLILHVMAAVAASRGEWYRYPISLHIVS